ncbi:MAG: PGF-pre-PGF domain-containing protein [Methanosarcina flavescens]|uniref:PGF-pre-PGF domain-containing protein n=1 Tax=Methanosarcina flavescens TaxID=1715806 RepID=UPI001D048CF0|nr:PGF-pre-PGF domain-containing protein [Methanosarcina flavescens]
MPGFVSGFALIFLLVWAVLPTSAAEIEASREISAETVYPGESFAVTVHIKADHELGALVLDEDLPGGWHVNYSENNGTIFPEINFFKATTLEWIWIENLSAGEEKTVMYNVTVPLNSQPGNFSITGRVSAYSVPDVPVEGFSEVTITYPPSEVDISASNGGEGSEGESSGSRGSEGENSGSGGSEGENSGSGGSRGGSGGGGGAGSPESTKNIELKEVSSEQVFKGTHTCFTFKGEINDIATVEFDPKKNFGKTTAIVEILKNTSSIVKEPAPGAVYRNINIWIGNSGFSSPENFENARINFRVSKAWIADHRVRENTVNLYRYDKGLWNPLSTSLNGEDENYFYFTAETPGFSPFAISGIEEKIQSVEISTARTGENRTLSKEDISDDKTNFDKEKQGVTASDIEKKEKKSSPEPGATFAVAELLILYGILKKKM